MAHSTSSSAPYNPFLGHPASPNLHIPFYQLNDHVRLSPTSTQSLTVTHLAFNPTTARFIYALRPSARTTPSISTLHITASEELLHRIPSLVTNYATTDSEEEEEEQEEEEETSEPPPLSGRSKRARLSPDPNLYPPSHSKRSSTTLTSNTPPSTRPTSSQSEDTPPRPKKALPVWISGTHTKIRIGDRAKANDGTRKWEGTVRSLPDAGYGYLTATTRNRTVRVFGPAEVLIKREGWLNE